MQSSITTPNMQVLHGNCLDILKNCQPYGIHLVFLDPPFNQGKGYAYHSDYMSENKYWNWIQEVVDAVTPHAVNGASLYFMHREKNTEQLLSALRNAGWTFQNLIIWRKLASANPNQFRYGKAYQVIAFATKGKRPAVFNRLRIDPPMPSNYRIKREKGVFVTDVWDDIRELTSGFLAGAEPFRNFDGTRFHHQQMPIALATRILLSSSMPGDTVLDPFAGTGTLVKAAIQIGRNAIGIDIDDKNVDLIKTRTTSDCPSDDILKRFGHYYRFTENFDKIFGNPVQLT